MLLLSIWFIFFIIDSKHKTSRDIKQSKFCLFLSVYKIHKVIKTFHQHLRLMFAICFAVQRLSYLIVSFKVCNDFRNIQTWCRHLWRFVSGKAMKNVILILGWPGSSQVTEFQNLYETLSWVMYLFQVNISGKSHIQMWWYACMYDIY